MTGRELFTIGGITYNDDQDDEEGTAFVREKEQEDDSVSVDNLDLVFLCRKSRRSKLTIELL